MTINVLISMFTATALLFCATAYANDERKPNGDDKMHAHCNTGRNEHCKDANHAERDSPNKSNGTPDLGEDIVFPRVSKVGKPSDDWNTVRRRGTNRQSSDVWR